MATAVAGVSIESVVIGAAVGGVFLVIQGVVQTYLSQYLKEKRDSERNRRKKERGKVDKNPGMGEHRGRNSPDSSSGVTPTKPRQRDEG